jgi:hypothetical protein
MIIGLRPLMTYMTVSSLIVAHYAVIPTIYNGGTPEAFLPCATLTLSTENAAQNLESCSIFCIFI